jgi:SAM-dependent methyltransferase
MTQATDYNRRTYDRIWPQMSDYIRFNPGARHRRRHIFHYLDSLRFRSLLDVGCGNAELLRLIDARYPGRSLTGVDLSAVAVADNSATYPHLHFAVANIEAEVPPGRHDVVVCSEVLEHLSDPQSALGRLREALVPGGHAIITTPMGKVHTTEKHFGHVAHPEPKDLVQWCEGAGLAVVDLRSWGFPMYRLTKWATNLNPDAALGRFAGERAYGLLERAISEALTVANFANLERSSQGVQLFALAKRV